MVINLVYFSLEILFLGRVRLRLKKKKRRLTTYVTFCFCVEWPHKLITYFCHSIRAFQGVKLAGLLNCPSQKK